MPGPKTARLIEVLDELAMLLAALGHGHWSDWMLESASRLRGGDFGGVTYLLRAYGGMGSFSDILAQEVDPGLERRVQRAQLLRAEAWTIAAELRRQVEGG